MSCVRNRGPSDVLEFDELDERVHGNSQASQFIDDPQGSWVAHCPSCGHRFDIQEIGYRSTNAFSWGLRRSLACPSCGLSNGMNVQHVDRNGVPDQPLGYVLRKTLWLHALIWGTLLAIYLIGFGLMNLVLFN